MKWVGLFFLLFLPFNLYAARIIGGGVSAISTNTSGSNNFIWNSNTLQSGATFYTSSGSIKGQLNLTSNDNDGTLDVLVIKSTGTTIGTASFSGSGLDDLTASGAYHGRTNAYYVVQIDNSAASPDTFKWSRDNGQTFVNTGVSITGSAQHLENGVYVTFGAVDGHTVDDKWTIYNTAYSGELTKWINSDGSVNASINNHGELVLVTSDTSTNQSIKQLNTKLDFSGYSTTMLNEYHDYLDFNIGGSMARATQDTDYIMGYGHFYDIDSTVQTSSGTHEATGGRSNIDFAGSVTSVADVNLFGYQAHVGGNAGTTGDTMKYGFYTNVSGTADDNIGLYVTVSGATENLGAWFNNGDILFDKDAMKSYWGETYDSYIEFDGDSMNIIANNTTTTDDMEFTADKFVFNGTVTIDGSVSLLSTGAIKASPMVIIASSDSTTDEKAIADYVCDGSTDNYQIRQAGLNMVTRLDNEGDGSGIFDKRSSNILTGNGFHYVFSNNTTYYAFGSASVCTSTTGGVTDWDCNSFTGDSWVLAVAWYESGEWRALARTGVTSGGIHYYRSTGTSVGDWMDQGEVISNEYDWETDAMDPSSVIKVGTTYYCHYNTAPGSDQRPRQTGVAWSTDLTNWTKYVGNPTWSAYRFCGFTIAISSTYYMFMSHEPAGSAVTGGNHGLSEIELWRSTDVKFLPHDRHFLGAAWGLSETSTDWDAANIDTPAIATNDIERSSFPASTIQCYYYATDKDGNNSKTGYVTGPSTTTLEGLAPGFMGGVLKLLPGEYDIQDTVFLRDHTILDAEGAVLNIEGGSWSTIQAIMPGEDTWIKPGLTIRDDDSLSDYGVYIRGVNHTIVDGVYFDNCKYYARTSNNVLRNSTFKGRDRAINIVTQGSNDGHHNIIENCLGTGLVDDSDDTRGGEFIYLENADHNIIRNCTAINSARLINIRTGSDYNFVYDSIAKHIRLGNGYTALVNIASGATGNEFHNIFIDADYLSVDRRGFWDNGTLTYINPNCRVINTVDDLAGTPTNPRYQTEGLDSGNVIGKATAGIDPKLSFLGETNSGLITWMEDEDWFEFDDVTVFNSSVTVEDSLYIDNPSGTGAYYKMDTNGTYPILTLGSDDPVGSQSYEINYVLQNAIRDSIEFHLSTGFIVSISSDSGDTRTDRVTIGRDAGGTIALKDDQASPVLTMNTSTITHHIATRQDDSIYSYFGSADDAYIYYDGSDMYIEPQNVGSGDVLIMNGKLGIGVSNPVNFVSVREDQNSFTRISIENRNAGTGSLTAGTNLRFYGPSGSIMANNYFDNYNYKYVLGTVPTTAYLTLQTGQADRMTVQADGDIYTESGVSLAVNTGQESITDMEVHTSLDTYTDTDEPENYALFLRKPTSTNNAGLGIAFLISALADDVGSSIINKRIGSNAISELQFHNKINTDSDGTITEMFTLESDGSLSLLGNTLIGAGVAGTDYTLTFDGETNDGVLTWMEDEDLFKFSDEVQLPDSERLLFGSALTGDTSFYFDADDMYIDISGATAEAGTPDVVVKLNDNAAASYFHVFDSDGVTQFNVNSDGHISSNGSISISSLVIQNSVTKQYSGTKTLSDGSATGIVDISIGTGEFLGGEIFYSIYVVGSGDYQSHSGSVNFNAVNKSETVTSDIQDVVPATESEVVTAGTLSDDWTVTDGSGKITINVNANTSLGSPTLTLYYTIFLYSGNTITPL